MAKRMLPKAGAWARRGPARGPSRANDEGFAGADRAGTTDPTGSSRPSLGIPETAFVAAWRHGFLDAKIRAMTGLA